MQQYNGIAQIYNRRAEIIISVITPELITAPGFFYFQRRKYKMAKRDFRIAESMETMETIGANAVTTEDLLAIILNSRDKAARLLH